MLGALLCAALGAWLLPHLEAQAADTTSTQASSAAHDQPTAPAAHDAAAAAPPAAADELALARAARDAGDAVQAELHYRNAIEHAPTAGAIVELLELLEADPARARDAGRLWKELLAEFPGDPAALLANGERLLAQGSAAAALAVFARGSEAAPSDARFQERMGDCHAALGRWPAAAQCYEQACRIEYAPSRVRQLAAALARGGNAQAAQRVWDDALHTHGGDADLAYQYALYLAGAGERDAALDELKHCLLLNPSHAAALDLAATLLQELGRSAEAAQYLTRANAAEPAAGRYLRQAAAQEGSGDPGGAERSYRAGLALAPDDARLLSGLANLLDAQQRWREGFALLQDACARTGDTALCLGAVRLALAHSDVQAAGQAYRAGLGAAPASVELNSGLCELYAVQGRDAELLSLVQSAAGVMQPAEQARLLGRACAALGRDDRPAAVDAARQLVAQWPTQAAPYLALAQQQEALGSAVDALATVRRGLNDAGGAYPLRLAEARLAGAVSGPQTGLQLADALLRDPRADADAFLLKLQFIGQQRDASGAAACAEEALRRFPQDARLLAALAQARLALGQDAQVAALLGAPEYAGLEYPERSLHLGLAYLHLGNYAKAAGQLTAANGVAPCAATAAALAEAYYFLGDLDAAEQALRSGLAAGAPCATLYVWQGFVQLARQQADAAAQSFDAASRALGATTADMAWCALGRAALALQGEDYATAKLRVDEAAAYGLADMALAAEITRLRGRLPVTVGGE